MRILYSVLAIALLAGCGAKKNNSKDPLDPNNSDDKNKKTEQTDDTNDSGSWSSKDRKQAMSDCIDYVTQKGISSADAKDGCSCTLDKIQGDMTFDDFEAIYQKEERPTSNKKMQQNYDKLDEEAGTCFKKSNKQTEDDFKPKKHKDDDDE